MGTVGSKLSMVGVINIYVVFVFALSCFDQLEAAETKEPSFLKLDRHSGQCKRSKKCARKGGNCIGLGHAVPTGASQHGYCDRRKQCKCFSTNVNQASCKPKGKCTKKGGKCYGQGEDIPNGAEYVGWCNKKSQCKCWREVAVTAPSPLIVCGEHRRCKSRGGSCYKNPPENFKSLGFFCNRKSKCKCYRESAPPTPGVRSSVCTVGGKTPGERCKFPFKFRGHWYNDCTMVGADDAKLWCSTKTDKLGTHVTGNWGHCGRCDQAAEKRPNFHFSCSMTNPKTKGVTGNSFQKWPNNEVPYQFDSSFTSTDRLAFIEATKHISAVTCISFVHKFASKYLRVRRDCSCGGSCFSGAYVEGLGAGSPRNMAVGSPCLDPNNQNSVGLLIHEILHALGIGHTQTRPDRNSYISVNYQNIQGGSSQFQLCSSCNTYGIPYDCLSIMHYRAWAFAPQSQQGKYSMTAKSSSCDLLKTNKVLRSTDIQLINKIYGCSSPAPTPAPAPSPITPSASSSCSGNCGGKALNCWCDAACTSYNDCCNDKATYCSSPSPSPPSPPSPPPPPPPPTNTCTLTCSNSCGSKVSCFSKSCYCDSFCFLYNDCCVDKFYYC